MVWAAPPAARADDDAAVFHVPPEAWTAGVRQRLVVQIERDWELARIWVAMRPLGSRGEYRDLPIERVSAEDFAAEVPRELVQPPGVEYYIASEAADGDENRLHFASAQAPQPVVVHGETAETRLLDRLARHHGNRSELRLSGEVTRYGSRYAEPSDDRTSGGLSDAGSDRFWLTRIDYTYRLLGVLYDIHFGLVLLRGHWATLTAPGETTVLLDVAPGTNEPGVNYGQFGLCLELHRNFSFEANMLLGASEDGFAAGFGSLFRIGRIAATRFEAGFELLQDIGHEGFFRFAWDTVDHFPMALMVELQNRPGGSNTPLGTRLIYELGAELGEHVTVTGRAGYAARTDATEGGFVLGLVTAVDF